MADIEHSDRAEIWGAFSPADHLRRRAFVADVLIYDRMVVPVPPKVDDPLAEKWRHRWNSQRQAELIQVIKAGGRDHIIEVPWDDQRQIKWEAYDEDTFHRSSRLEAASQVENDVADVQNRRAANPDTPKQFSERSYLVDYQQQVNDEALARTIPDRCRVTVVAAYGSYGQFRKDVTVGLADSDSTEDYLLGAFAWPLLVPSSSLRSDEDLLREAVELAALKEVEDYRTAYHDWRYRLMTGHRSAESAEVELTEMIGDYKNAVRAAHISTAWRTAVIVLVGGAAATIGSFVAGPAGAFVGGLGAKGADQVFSAWKLKVSTPETVMPAALFHEARKRFGGWS